jgi:hypothetical protein
MFLKFAWDSAVLRFTLLHAIGSNAQMQSARKG